MWGGKGVERDSSVKPGSWFHLECPLGVFLEPSIRLVKWRRPQPRSHCWRPFTRDAAPYPWPLGDSPHWVNLTVERPLTGKEKSQLRCP